MKAIVLDVKTWGNSLGVRLPSIIAKQANLTNNQSVMIDVDGTGKIIITPIQKQALTLEQRLNNFDPTLHGGEAMTTSEMLGAEKW